MSVCQKASLPQGFDEIKVLVCLRWFTGVH